MSAKHSETHSALPFAVGNGSYNERSNKYDVVITSQSRDVCTMELYYDDAEANAAYIVRCVNSHEALVSAVQNAINAIETDMSNIADDMRLEAIEALDALRDALSLARGGGE